MRMKAADARPLADNVGAAADMSWPFTIKAHTAKGDHGGGGRAEYNRAEDTRPGHGGAANDR